MVSYLIVVLLCIYLMISDVEHLVPWINMCLVSLLIFNWFVFYYSVMSSLYIVDVDLLLNV